MEHLALLYDPENSRYDLSGLDLDTAVALLCDVLIHVSETTRTDPGMNHRPQTIGEVIEHSRLTCPFPNMVGYEAYGITA